MQGTPRQVSASNLWLNGGWDVRGTGGVFIHNRQAVWLKEYVTKANPMIVSLTDDVWELVEKKLIALPFNNRNHLARDTLRLMPA